MAYKYFSKQLLESNELDLNEVFYTKQNTAREQGGVSYGLLDIVLFLKDKTSNFSISDQTYIELDTVIEEIVNRYYKSINQTNPFKGRIKIKPEFKPGVVPKEGFDVKDGKVSGRGVIKPAASTEEPSAYEQLAEQETAEVEEKLEAPTDTAKEQVQETIEAVDKVIEADKIVLAKLEKLRKDIAGAQFFIDDEDTSQEDKTVMLSQMKKRLASTEDLIEDGDDSEYVLEVRKLLKDFVEKNS